MTLEDNSSSRITLHITTKMEDNFKTMFKLMIGTEIKTIGVTKAEAAKCMEDNKRAITKDITTTRQGNFKTTFKAKRMEVSTEASTEANTEQTIGVLRHMEVAPMIGVATRMMMAVAKLWS